MREKIDDWKKAAYLGGGFFFSYLKAHAAAGAGAAWSFPFPFPFGED